jgi:hypothetical protein
LYHTIFGHCWPPSSEATASTTHVKFKALWCSTCFAESLKISILGPESGGKKYDMYKIPEYQDACAYAT